MGTAAGFTQIIDTHCQVIAALKDLAGQIEALADRMLACLEAGGKILWMGNGGSAADSQHLAAELVVRYRRNRRALPSIALTTDTSILTAHANDFGFDGVFARQIEALARPGDMVMAISTSGNSPNILLGIEAARRMDAYTVGWTGATGGRLLELADETLRVPSEVTARIQEAQIMIGHYLCEVIEDRLVV